MTYRKDIQILRGVSVLLVVLFHYGFLSFGSGFLGVDVFFVISGFLMAVLYREDDKYEFFLRRARRLLPAYFVTVFFTVFVVILLATPNDVNSVSKQSIFATFFTSNIGYWSENSYFSKTAFNPLLHLWSLGVEIQFYLLIPLLFWIFKKNKIFLPIVLISSLISCFIIVELSAKTSFFMMPLRLWEFLIGCLVAVFFTNNGVVEKKSAVRGVGGLALIVIVTIPLVSIEPEASSFIYGHPGLYAFVVSIATGIVLALGLPTFFEKSMLAGLFEVFGKYSYSIYLVHFPVIVLLLYRPFSGTILYADSALQIVEMVAITAVLSFLMYHFVEKSKFNVKNLPKKLMIFAGITLFLSLIGPSVQPLMYSEKEMMISEAWDDRDIYRCGKLARIANPSSISCEITSGISPSSNGVLLVGDSHADSIKHTFASVAEGLNLRVRFMVGNAPLMGGDIDPNSVVNEALFHNIDAIVLHYSKGSVDVPIIKHLLELTEKYNIAVSLVMPVPTWDEHIPKALWENLKYEKQLPHQALSDYESENSKLYNELIPMASGNFNVFSVGGVFCSDSCLISDGLGRPFYFDDSHLTLTGSRLLASLFEKILLKSSDNDEGV